MLAVKIFLSNIIFVAMVGAFSINELPKEISESGLKIHKSLAGSSVTEFLVVLESQIGVFCDVSSAWLIG